MTAATLPVTSREARFAPGAWVRVQRERPPESVGRRHIRTPLYLWGARGRVAAVVGAFRNPEGLAVGESGLPVRWLYRVRFPLASLWHEPSHAPGDTLDVEVYEHWLEADPDAP